MRHKMLIMMLLAMPLVLASSAYADLISVGLQEPGVNGGAITTEVTGSGTVVFSGAYGTWNINVATATDFTVLLGGACCIPMFKIYRPPKQAFLPSG